MYRQALIGTYILIEALEHSKTKRSTIIEGIVFNIKSYCRNFPLPFCLVVCVIRSNKHTQTIHIRMRFMSVHRHLCVRKPVCTKVHF